MVMYCTLSEFGFGSIKELMTFDTPDILDMLEFIQIKSAIEDSAMRKSNGNS